MKSFKKIHRLFILGLYFSATPLMAAPDIDAQLLKRIDSAQQRLSAMEKSITSESVSFERKFNHLQDEVGRLRDQAAGLQRLSDEKLLGLDQLKQRVEKWSTQSNYQKHLLTAYLEFERLPLASNLESGAALQAVLAEIEKKLNPAWSAIKVVNADGEIIDADFLKIGPLEFALAQDRSEGGLLVKEGDSESYIAKVMQSEQRSALTTLHENNVGEIIFDPTLGNAYQLLSYESNLYAHLKKGGVWALPILFFGLLSFVIAVIKAAQFIRLPRIDINIAEKLNALLSKMPVASNGEALKKIAALESELGEAQRRLLYVCKTTAVSGVRDDLLVANLMEFRHSIERYMGVVATSAAVAPLLGLLGTVSGMINTFKMMTIFGTGDAATVSGGISEALVTTELGLVVAIPSLIISALMTRKSKSYMHALETVAIKLSKIEFPTLKEVASSE